MIKENAKKPFTPGIPTTSSPRRGKAVPSSTTTSRTLPKVERESSTRPSTKTSFEPLPTKPCIPTLRDSEIETKRFLREARVTANIQHPGTLPVYELGRDREGQLFFTMKKVEGRDLRQILLDLRHEVPDVMEAFPLPRLLDILIQVCQTIAYAHDAGVIHRDLKPANVIVGKFGEVYVLDWGLAKVMGSPRGFPHPNCWKRKTSKASVSPRREGIMEPHVHVSRNRPR